MADLAPCVDLLGKYADNILANPDDPKYRRIKLSNKTFAEKVKGVPGAVGVLKTAGFEDRTEETEAGQEQFLVYPMDRSPDYLTEMKKLLQQPLAVDRDIQVFSPSQDAMKVDLSEAEYAVSKEELVAEQQRRRAEIELSQTLRTKEMRERDELKV